MTTVPKPKLKVLIVDDNRDARVITSSLFESLGVQAVTTSQPNEALSIALNAVKSSTPFDLLLIDIQMPEMNGVQLAENLREGGYKGPIVAFTANPTGKGRKDSGLAGINAYFSKTTLKKELLAAILEEFCGYASPE